MDDHFPPEEDLLVLPESLRRNLTPRRGGALPLATSLTDRAVGEIAPGDMVDAGAADVLAGLLQEHREHLEKVLSAGKSDAAMVGHARAYLDGADDPAGAAAILHLAEGVHKGPETPRIFTDGWVVERGPAFAACALAELAGVSGAPGALRPIDTLRQVDPVSLRRVRGLLAFAGEEEYEQAVEGLSAHRRTRAQRMVASYLVPTRHEWVDECCAEPPADEWGSPRAYRDLLWASIGTPRHLDLLGDWRLEDSDFGPFSFGLRATMADGVGPAIAPVLVSAWDRIKVYKLWLEGLVELISLLPSDEAFELLLERYDREHAGKHFRAAMERFPRRAVRVLSKVAASDSNQALLAAGLLHLHLQAHPELAGPSTPARVPDAPAAEIPAVLTGPGRAARLPDYADPDALPQVLVRGGGRALPAAATKRLVALAKKPDERLEAVRDACDRRSLADFGWALFLHGDAWALPALGWLGDDRTARDLAALLPGWADRGTRARAVKGIDAIARIGTPGAHVLLTELAETSPHDPVRKAALQGARKLAP
ncbi:hypothetical protein [Actinomadura oligospora]|uniref:hypothetical protein n=1 Tax=Actinomadura oligospora TaxID=111804 RepID=UPI0004B65101|nr:hypothetical protein [Actinomadura oligospora]